MYDVSNLYKEIKKNNEAIVFNGMLNAITSAFSWNGFPETVRPEFGEIYLNLYGACAIVEIDGDYFATMVNRGGKPDVYGLGEIAIISTRNGYTKEYRVKGDLLIREDGSVAGVIMYNNNLKCGNTFIRIFASLMVEAITSFYQNITHSRYTPVFVAQNDIIKKAIENAMPEIIAGKPVVIVADNIFTEIESGIKTLETVPITDVDKQEKIQFISKTIDDLFRWFLSMYGQAVQGNGKLAQQTVDEVNGTTSASFILPECGYRWRQHACDLLNRELGWNCSISYNKPWAVELEKYTEDVEESEDQSGEDQSGEDQSNDDQSDGEKEAEA